MHESILPHLAQPSLMIDFLTRAYDVGEQGAPRGAVTTWGWVLGVLFLPCETGRGEGRRACGQLAPIAYSAASSFSGLALGVGGRLAAAPWLCLSAGGAISLLALNGLFILIHEHNL